MSTLRMVSYRIHNYPLGAGFVSSKEREDPLELFTRLFLVLPVAWSATDV